ncbi:MAG TPA: MarR family transcriptional regulator [Steroidobacteraceae bacterium]|nr:MarR family transcriptional regulator [Steroidobacteraceae bacterium]
MSAVTAAAGLTVAQYTVLSVLRARGQLSNAQLAQRALVSPQAMNEIIQELTRKEIVQRQLDPAHRRIVRLMLTPLGVRRFASCDAAVRRLERHMLRGFSERERGELQRMLRLCTQRLEAPANLRLTAAASRTTVQGS